MLIISFAWVIFIFLKKSNFKVWKAEWLMVMVYLYRVQQRSQEVVAVEEGVRLSRSIPWVWVYENENIFKHGYASN